MDIEQQRIAAHIAWLKTASPDDWHRVALDFNWDEAIEPLFWIAQQPDCDRATALDIFWKAQPAWYLLMALEKGDAYEDYYGIGNMVAYIANRLKAKGYTRTKIAFDATPGLRQDYEELRSYEAKLPNAPFKAHPDMLRSIRGREVLNDMDFYRRYPAEFHHSVMFEGPELDEAVLEFPDMWDARVAAIAGIANMFALGFILVYVALFSGVGKSSAWMLVLLLWTIYTVYSVRSNVHELLGLLRGNRLYLDKTLLAGVFTLSGLLGVALAALAGQRIATFLAWFPGAYGWAAKVVVAVLVAGPLLLGVGFGLCRILLSHRTLRSA